jgi:hypothetical protein
MIDYGLCAKIRKENGEWRMENGTYEAKNSRAV